MVQGKRVRTALDDEQLAAFLVENYGEDVTRAVLG